MSSLKHNGNTGVGISLTAITVGGVETIQAIEERRSIGRLVDPAPNSEQLEKLLHAARRAPDHKSLQPWKFIVLEGAQRREIGDVFAQTFAREHPEATPDQVEKQSKKFERAPMIIAVGTQRLETRLPFEELLAATAAAIQNLLLAATDMGFGTMWRTGDAAYDPAVKRALGMNENDFISGFIYIGTKPED